MIVPRIRPRFKINLDIDPDECVRRTTEELGRPECPVEAQVAGSHVDLMIPKVDRHFWSPRLSLNFMEEAPGTRLRGLYGPRPAVWTMFAMFYCALGFIAVMGAMFGYSQWIIDQYPWAFWSVPVAVAGAILAYLVSLAGQRLALEEMQMLHRYTKKRLGVDIPSPYSS